MKIFAIISILFFSFTLAGCEPRLYRDKQVMMGTFVEVVSPDPRAAAIAFNEMKRIEKLFSLYDPESELSALNRDGEVKASPEVIFVIQKSIEFWEATQGAFDITVAPLAQLWGFKDKDFRVPGDEEIATARGLTGSDKISVNLTESMVKLGLPGMKIDCGAVAKGFAVDQAIAAVKHEGITECLVSAGGDIYCLGGRRGSPWIIAVQDPGRRGFKGTLRLRDRAVATSGDYEQFFVQDSKHFSHIIDPLTGYPADGGIASVTVIADDCLTADALATAFCVKGKSAVAGLLARFPGAEVKFIKR